MDFDPWLVIHRVGFAGFTEDLRQASEVMAEGALNVGEDREPHEKADENYDESCGAHAPPSPDPTFALLRIMGNHGKYKTDDEAKHVAEIIRPGRKPTDNTY